MRLWTGTFYVNGPGRIRIGDNKYGHWFDGAAPLHRASLYGPLLFELAACALSARIEALRRCCSLLLQVMGR
jgi:hypothetical protein